MVVKQQEAERTNPIDRGAQGPRAEREKEEEVSVSDDNDTHSPDTVAEIQNHHRNHDQKSPNSNLRISTSKQNVEQPRVVQKFFRRMKPMRDQHADDVPALVQDHDETERTDPNDGGLRGPRAEREKEGEVSGPHGNINLSQGKVAKIKNHPPNSNLGNSTSKPDVEVPRVGGVQKPLFKRKPKRARHAHDVPALVQEHNEAERSTDPNDKGLRGSRADTEKQGKVSVPPSNDNRPPGRIADVENHPGSHHQLPNSNLGSSGTSTGKPNDEVQMKRSVQMVDANKPFKKRKLFTRTLEPPQ